MKTTVTSFSFLLITIFSFSQSWEMLSPLPASADERHHPATFAIDGIGYLVAGADANSVSMKDFYAYDPMSDTWTQKADFPGQSRGFSYAVASETKGYLGFGYSNDPNTGADEYLKDLWEYDPQTDTWTELASCPGSARIHPAMIYLDGKIYMGCGGNVFGDLGDWWEYDIDTDTWTPRASFPGPNRHHPYYFAIGDYAYVGFGHSGPNIYDDMYRYDPVGNIWSQMASLPDQGRVAGTQFTYGGKGYLLSGQGETHQNLPTGEFWEYDPIANDWTELTAHPGGGRWAPGSFVINGGVYFMCGESNSGNEKDLMRYQIEGFATQENVANMELTIYPNPADNQFVVSGLETTANVRVLDMNGKSCWEKQVQPNDLIDVSGLSMGVYSCLIEIGNEQRVEKLVIR